MKQITKNVKVQENSPDKVDAAIDNLLERVTNKLIKLKNNDYLMEYLIKSGLSTDLANKLIHPNNSEHTNK